MGTEDILQFCLEEITAGRKSAVECIAAFPDIPDLGGQLQAAVALWSWTPPTLCPESSYAIGERIMLEAKLRRGLRPAQPQAIAANGQVRWEIQSLRVGYVLISMLLEGVIRIFHRP